MTKWPSYFSDYSVVFTLVFGLGLLGNSSFLLISQISLLVISLLLAFLQKSWALLMYRICVEAHYCLFGTVPLMNFSSWPSHWVNLCKLRRWYGSCGVSLRVLVLSTFSCNDHLSLNEVGDHPQVDVISVTASCFHCWVYASILYLRCVYKCLWSQFFLLISLTTFLWTNQSWNLTFR